MIPFLYKFLKLRLAFWLNNLPNMISKKVSKFKTDKTEWSHGVKRTESLHKEINEIISTNNAITLNKKA